MTRPLSLRKKASSCFLFYSFSAQTFLLSAVPPVPVTGQQNMVAVSVSFFAFFAHLIGHFWPQISLAGIIPPNGKKRCLVVFRYHFGTILSGLLLGPAGIRIVPVLFFPWILLLSFFLLRSNITNGESRQSCRNLPFVLCLTFQWTPISDKMADHRGYGESKSQARALLGNTRLCITEWILLLEISIKITTPKGKGKFIHGFRYYRGGSCSRENTSPCFTKESI